LFLDKYHRPEEDKTQNLTSLELEHGKPRTVFVLNITPYTFLKQRN